MLQMIFQNEDLMDDYKHYYNKDYNHNQNDNQNYNDDYSLRHNKKIIKNNYYYNSYVESNNDDEWGFYVEIDYQTPPKHIFPKKNKNTVICSHYNYNNETQQKNVNYLHEIHEEYNSDDDQFILDMDLPPHHSNDKPNNYKEKISKNIFSGLTICALTTASIYFYNKIRNS